MEFRHGNEEDQPAQERTDRQNETGLEGESSVPEESNLSVLSDIDTLQEESEQDPSQSEPSMITPFE
jgi:hypothetical protein